MQNITIVSEDIIPGQTPSEIKIRKRNGYFQTYRSVNQDMKQLVRNTFIRGACLTLVITSISIIIILCITMYKSRKSVVRFVRDVQTLESTTQNLIKSLSVFQRVKMERFYIIQTLSMQGSNNIQHEYGTYHVECKSFIFHIDLHIQISISQWLPTERSRC